MIIGLLNQKGGVGKTTLAVHIADALARRKKKVLLVDADPQGSALDWAASRSSDPLFPVAGLPRPSIHKELPALAQGYEHVLIDGPPRVYEVARSAIMASDVVLIPVQPSPYDVWAAVGRDEGGRGPVFSAPMQVSSVSGAYPPLYEAGDDFSWVIADQKYVDIGWGDARDLAVGGGVQTWFARIPLTTLEGGHA